MPPPKLAGLRAQVRGARGTRVRAEDAAEAIDPAARLAAASGARAGAEA